MILTVILTLKIIRAVFQTLLIRHRRTDKLTHTCQGATSHKRCAESSETQARFLRHSANLEHSKKGGFRRAKRRRGEEAKRLGGEEAKS